MSLDEKGVKAMMIIEVAGKPAEHLTDTLNKFMEAIDKEKGVKITSKKVNDPAPMKDQEGFFTSFAEVEVEVDEVLGLAILLFKYMPAHIEILEPENIKFSNNGLSEVFNELARRLHGYDEVARVVQAEKGILENKLKALMDEKGVKEPEKSEPKEPEEKKE